MSVFKADPRRESRRGHPTTNVPRQPAPGSGQGPAPAYPGSGGMPSTGGWSAPIPPSGGARSAPSGTMDYSQFMGRIWRVEVFSNNQNIARIPVHCPPERLPSFTCVCGVRVGITMDMNNPLYQLPYGFLWIFTHEAGQWQNGYAYNDGTSLGTCPVCRSQLQLLGPM